MIWFALIGVVHQSLSLSLPQLTTLQEVQQLQAPTFVARHREVIMQGGGGTLRLHLAVRLQFL